MNKHLANVYKMTIIAIFQLLISAFASAQPPAGVLWPARALNYAEYWWNTSVRYNPDYMYWTLQNDCANFQSQIAQAGCAGLCEYNNTNNYGGYNWTTLILVSKRCLETRILLRSSAS